MALHVADHLPAVGFEALGGVVGEPALDVAVDGDVVVVVEGDQLAQAPGAGERAGFVRDAFHQAAVAEEDIGVVIDDLVAGAVEVGGQQLFGQRHAHRVGDALAERAGGGLDAGRVAVFGVAGGLAVQLAETLQFLDRQVVAGEVQQRVDQHRAVAVGQHEAVAVGPLGVRRIVLQVVAPQHFGDLGHAHRRTGVAGVGLLHGVHRQGADCAGDRVEDRRLDVAGRLHAVFSGRRPPSEKPQLSLKSPCRCQCRNGASACPALRCAAHTDCRRRSISFQISGVRINCIARSSLPPGMTMVLARLMKALGIMFSR